MQRYGTAEGSGMSWLLKVALATAALTALGVFASPGRAMAAEQVQGGNSLAHALTLLALAWLLSSIRVQRIGGRWRLRVEPSPVRRVRALSAVHRARRSTETGKYEQA